MSEWREVALGGLCERVTVGHVGRMADRYVTEGVPFLRSQNIKPFRVDTEGILYVDPAFHRKLAKSELRAGDVAIVRTGYPGTAAVVPPSLDGSNCADLVIITPSVALNPHMLAAVLNSSWGQRAVGGHLVGAAQQHFNVGSAKSLVVRLPDRAAQDKIAAVICSLNDLIENSRRRVEVLEEMARAIYREWFIHFRFPGYENATFVDSDLGPIPEGWSVLALARIADVNQRSRTPAASETFRYLDISCLGERRTTVPTAIDGAEAPGRARRVVQAGDVVWSMVRPNRRAHALLVDPGEDWIASTGTAVLTAVAVPSSFLFEAVSHSSFSNYLVSRQRGSAYPAVEVQAFKDAPIITAPGVVLDRFEEAIGANHRLAWELQVQAHVLGQVRDMLLPKLVTGQIDVSDLDLDAVVERVAG